MQLWTLRDCRRRRDCSVEHRINEIGTLGLLTKRTYGGRSHWEMGVPVVFDDALENCEFEDAGYASDLTDADSDDECVATPQARVERVGSGSSKRTYGVIVGNGVVPERRVRTRIDEKIEELRAVISSSCTDDEACLLTGVHKYIENLQRQIQELHYELGTESCSDVDEASSCDDDGMNPSCTVDERPLDSNSAFEWSSASHRGRSRSRVEVLRSRAGMRIRVECAGRAGLLDEVMSVLESRGLNVEEASVSFEGRFALDCIASVVGRKRAVECRHVGARLKSLISDH